MVIQKGQRSTDYSWTILLTILQVLPMRKEVLGPGDGAQGAAVHTGDATTTSPCSS